MTAFLFLPSNGESMYGLYESMYGESINDWDIGLKWECLGNGMFCNQYCFICYYWGKRNLSTDFKPTLLVQWNDQIDSLFEDLASRPASESLFRLSWGSSVTSVLWILGEGLRIRARRRGFQDWLYLGAGRFQANCLKKNSKFSKSVSSSEK